MRTTPLVPARRSCTLAVLLLAAAVFAAPAARADPPGATPADTSLGRYLDSLRDSSNTFFRTIVAPVDTAGLDSVLAARLANPGKERFTSPGTWKPAVGPWLGFNRIDGPVYGGAVAIGRRRSLGVLGGRAGYGVASDTWLGAGEYSKTFETRSLAWRFDAEAGRLTAGIDRERSDLRLGALRAFLTGNDTRRYLRHDGLSTQLAVDHPAWRGSLRYRDMLESPLDVHARWSLLSGSLAVSDNLAAVRGHVHELD